jgi:putative transposase
MLKTFKYHLYLTKQQQRLLDQQLEECRWLYIYLRAQWRDPWEQQQESLQYHDHAASLPALQVERPSLSGAPSQVLHTVAVRIDRGFQAFVQRTKESEREPGYPRFRGRGQDDSITFPQVPVGRHVEVDAKRLRIANVADAKVGCAKVGCAKVGCAKVLIHRPVEGIIKTATIRHIRTRKWHMTYSCDCATQEPLSPTGLQVGADVGLTVFAALSTEEVISNAHFFRAEEQALAKARRHLSPEEQNTPARLKQRCVVARVPERVRWRRSDSAQQHSRCIVNRFDLTDLIAGEDLAVEGMTHNHTLAKSIDDAAWSQFASLLAYKGAWADPKVVAVTPHTRVRIAQAVGSGKRSPSITASTRAPSVGTRSTETSTQGRTFRAWGNSLWLRPSESSCH